MSGCIQVLQHAPEAQRGGCAGCVTEQRERAVRAEEQLAACQQERDIQKDRAFRMAQTLADALITRTSLKAERAQDEASRD